MAHSRIEIKSSEDGLLTELKIDGNVIHGVRTVSYTHLDVYKRQVQFYAPENWQGSIYQYFSAVVSGSIRINYRMVYVYE